MPSNDMQTPLPIFLDLAKRPVLIVGGGSVALRKVTAVRKTNAQVTVIAPDLCIELQKLATDGQIRHLARGFQEGDTAGFALVFAATNDDAVNRALAIEARAAGIPVNVADKPDQCTFVMPSIIERHPVQIAISSAGASPLLARLLRARLETLIPAGFGELAKLVAGCRDKVKQRFSNLDQRRRFWEEVLQGPIAELFFSGQQNEAMKRLEAKIESASDQRPLGEVYLVGAGPGDPDLLTFRALRLMQQAEVVLFDRLVAPELVALVRKDAERIFVGKEPGRHTVRQEEINALLVKLAKAGKRVLRLKGGDPFIFGRGGEEIDSLAAEHIPFQVVPGITAAAGCASYAGIPLTHRDYAQSCVFVTGHLVDGKLGLNWQALAQPETTIAVYMGVGAAGQLAEGLINHGLNADTPVAVIESGSTANQRVLTTSLAELGEQVIKQGIKAPAMIIIGRVVELREKLAWFQPDDQSHSLSGPI
jgi:uroporphyrin-III C-methyltransferase/precorrin-2 dehydrogenase/sirohydrochlorin ferrochelatase